MTDSLKTRLRSWLDVASLEDVLHTLLLVAQEAQDRGARRGYGSFCERDEEEQ